MRIDPDIKELLKRHGFTKNEILFYFALIKLEEANASEIARYAQSDKSSMYRAARSLLKRGYIVETGAQYDKKYMIEDLTILRSKLESKQKQLNKDISLASSFIDTFPRLAEKEFIKSNVKVYSGDEGVRRVYEERLDWGESIIREVTSNVVQNNLTIKDPKYWNSLIKERKEKGIYLHMLVDEEDTSVDFHRSSKDQHKEVRLTNSDLSIPAGLQIVGNKIIIHNTNSLNIITLVIEDKAIASLFSNLFDFVWKRSKKI